MPSLYRRAAHRNLTHRRRTSFYSLPRVHQDLLQKAPISYLKTLGLIDEAIERNSLLAESIFRSAADAFGIEINVTRKASEQHPSSEDLDKVRSTLKQFYRDWSVEGQAERTACYGPVMGELEERFGNLGDDKSKVRIVVPGAGLARLAFDIAVAGYTSQGNEFSYHQLMASNFILNHTTKANEFTIHPFISTFSNHRTRKNQLRYVSIPDVHPAALLSACTPNQRSDNTPVGERFSMIAGDFQTCYNSPDSASTFDVCATVFFLDTAPNICAYLTTIRNLLVPGGLWINLGPLLWHYEDQKPPKRDDDEGSVELSLDEVLKLVEMSGFKIVKRRSGETTAYVGDELSMLSHIYEGEFWVAEKV